MGVSDGAAVLTAASVSDVKQKSIKALKIVNYSWETLFQEENYIIST